MDRRDFNEDDTEQDNMPSIKFKKGDKAPVDQCDSSGWQGSTGPSWPGTLTEQQKRLGTYKGWPPDKVQTPISLADAGFSYTGKSDEVVCQYCDIHLHTWEPTDVPMDEHLRYNPRCPYIRQFQ